MPASVVVRYVVAVRGGDIDAVRGLFAEDATWEYPGDLPLSRTRARPRRRVDLTPGSGRVRACWCIRPAEVWEAPSPSWCRRSAERSASALDRYVQIHNERRCDHASATCLPCESK